MRPSLLRTLDRYLGTLLYLICCLFRVFSTKKDTRNVLVVKLWALGESVLILPSVNSVHEKGYNVTILCTAQNKAIFEHQSFIDRILVLDTSNPLKALLLVLSLRKYRFSVAIDSDPYMKFSAVLTILSGASKRFGFENRRLLYTRWVPIQENEHAILSFYRIFKAFIDFPVPKALTSVYVEKFPFNITSKSIAIHAGSAPTSAMRRWPEERFAKICDYFSSHGWKIYLTGSSEESGINQRILSFCQNKSDILDMSGKMSIHQLAYLFSKVRLVVANDSGPMHIAASTGTPTLGLFGPNVPERFGPFGKNCIGLRRDGPVCIQPFRAIFPDCDHDHMKSLTTQEVLKTAKKLISGNP